MTDSPDPARAQCPSVVAPAPDHPSALADFDLADFEWVPVHRRRRADGWSVDRQRRFIEALAATGSVTRAAQEVGMSIAGCYRLRNAPGGAPFAAAWKIAVDAAARRLTDLAMDRVVHGSDEPVFDRDGTRVGRRIRYNDRLLMFMLRALQPDRFGAAPRAEAAPSPPVAEALAGLLGGALSAAHRDPDPEPRRENPS